MPANQGKWQYRILETLERDADLRSQADLGPSVRDLAEQIVQDLLTTGSYWDLGALAGLIQGSLGTGTDTATSVAKRILNDYPAPDSLVLANFLKEQLGADMVRIAADEMQSERGFFRCLALVMAQKYLCGNPELQEKIKESLERGGASLQLATPQGLMAAGAVMLANQLVQAVPWLGPGSLPVVVGFTILVGNVGLDGFCMWVKEYVSPRDQPDVES